MIKLIVGLVVYVLWFFIKGPIVGLAGVDSRLINKALGLVLLFIMGYGVDLLYPPAISEA